MLEGIWNIHTGGFECEFSRAFLPVCAKNVAAKSARTGLTEQKKANTGAKLINLANQI